LRVAWLTNYTAEPLAPVLCAHALASGLLIRPYVPAFDTWMQEIVDDGSQLRRFEPDVVLLDLFADAWCPLLSRAFLSLDESAVETAIASAAAVVSDGVRALRRWSRAKIVVHLVPRPLGASLGILEDGRVGQRAAFDRLNERLHVPANDGDVFFLRTDELIGELGYASWHDARLWAAAKVPYTAAAMHRVAEEHLRYLRAFAGRVRKVLVLDLDDTLWGGVLGEQGQDGVALGSSYPGNAFVEFQQAVAELQRRGVVLALNSSNDADEALRMLDSHPSMVLRRASFSAYQINWQDKAQNMRQLSADLGLGLESFVFIDNSAAECARMRQALPEVLTCELHGEPASHAQWLRTLGVFDSLSYTDEDRQRGAFYRGEAQRAHLRDAAGSLDDYLASLEMELTFEPVGASTVVRAADLTQRTNQFNMTTRRRTADEIRAWVAAAGREAYVCHLTDRFGPQGIVAYASLDGVGQPEIRIADLLVSCRVLKRGVEKAILAQLVARARQSGARALIGVFEPTRRNAPFADFYRASGFPLCAGDDRTEFAWPVDQAFETPSHISVAWRSSPSLSPTA
jgi:FkbH-like protein